MRYRHYKRFAADCKVKFMKKDIENRNDVQLLIDSFYEKVKADKVIGYIFNDIAKVNWEKHLPVMYDFWENVLFFTGTYNRNPITPHINLHQVASLTKEHFTRWLQLLLQRLMKLFKGEKTKLEYHLWRARRIATSFTKSLIDSTEGTCTKKSISVKTKMIYFHTRINLIKEIA